MQLNDKIAELRELFAERDEIDRRIEAVIGSATAVPIPEKPAKAPVAAKSGYKCSVCGKAGHTARKCPKKDAPKQQGYSTALPLSEDQFDEVKHLREIGDLNTSTYAKEHDVTLSEVNRAVFAKDYEEYSEPF